MIYVFAGMIAVFSLTVAAVYAFSSRCKIAEDEFAIVTQGTRRRVVCGSADIFVFKPFHSVIRTCKCEQDVLLTNEIERFECRGIQHAKIELSGSVTTGTEPDLAIQYAIRFGTQNAEAKSALLTQLNTRLRRVLHRWASDFEHLAELVEGEVPPELDSTLRVTSSQFGLLWRSNSLVLLPVVDEVSKEVAAEENHDILGENRAQHRVQEKSKDAQKHQELLEIKKFYEAEKEKILKAAESDSITDEVCQLTKTVENDVIQSKADMEEAVPEEHQIRDAYARKNAARQSLQLNREAQLRQGVTRSDAADR